MSAQRPLRDLRASDADRERVATALAQAAADGRLTPEEHAQRAHGAYAARTLGELAVLTSDLGGSAAQPLRLDGSRAVVAFFRREERAGRWVVPQRLLVAAVGGHVVLDLREALLAGLHTVVQATLIGGQAHLLVPDGVEVTVIRTGQGAQPAPGPAPRPAGGRPLIEVRAFMLAGRVRVHTPRPPGRKLGRFGRRGPAAR